MISTLLPTISISDHDTVDGWTVGAGAEYRHAEFSEAKLSIDGSHPNISSSQDMRELGASWKF